VKHVVGGSGCSKAAAALKAAGGATRVRAHEHARNFKTILIYYSAINSIYLLASVREAAVPRGESQARSGGAPLSL